MLEEVLALIDAAATLVAEKTLDSRYSVALRVVAATGLGRGEACALRWSDIGWEAATLTVDESVIPADGGAVIKSPKTRARIRQVAIDKGTIAALRKLRAEQEDLAALGNITIPDERFVFSAEPDGQLPPYPDTLSRAFLKVRLAAKLPEDLHLHSLRHFQATSLVSQ